MVCHCSPALVATGGARYGGPNFDFCPEDAPLSRSSRAGARRDGRVLSLQVADPSMRTVHVPMLFSWVQLRGDRRHRMVAVVRSVSIRPKTEPRTSLRGR